MVVAGGLGYLHHDFYSAPGSRLALDAQYDAMPEDRFNHYLNLPIDHDQPSRGLFRAFYRLSPNFNAGQGVTLLLTDGQMELVSETTDFEFFENVMRGGSYVVMGVRGQAPTYFPEVYRDGKVDHRIATRLLGSDQQVRDIEGVRQDLIRKGLLGKDSKINLFGASGAGVLAQQYVSDFGQHVRRVILESTGAPDLSQQSGTHYSPDFKQFNPDAAARMEALLRRRPIDKQALANVLYQAGRSETAPRDAQSKIIEDLARGAGLWKYQLKPVSNLSLLDYIVKSPRQVMARVRWFELVGSDLLRYDTRTRTNLLYELSTRAVSDLQEFHVSNRMPAKTFVIRRGDFEGEVLILKGTEDVVFSDEINRRLREAYPRSRLLLFKDGHRLQNEPERYISIRNTFLSEGFESEHFNQLVGDHEGAAATTLP